MNDKRIDLLKRCARALSRVYHKYPADQTYADLQELEEWIEELGGDSRSGTHRAIMESELPELDQAIKKELDSSD